MGPSMVLPDCLYIAGEKEASAMYRMPFKRFARVVCCNSSRDACTPYPCDEQKLVHVHDEANEDIKQFFPGVIRYISECPGRVLVHCRQGRSRSASCVLAYLMQVHALSLKVAFELLVEKRSCVCVNQGFAKQLVEFENELRGTNSLSVLQMQGNCWASPYLKAAKGL